MSKIQKLPQTIQDNITPYLVSEEKIGKSLLQDNKKPREIWLIQTNQAIILHGTQPDKQQPAIMVFPLDELKEIDYLQKQDDIQIILYSGKNGNKAVFHFEVAAAKEIENFFMDLGDVITFRYQGSNGKITVVQKALPIGDKNRKIFGRGKPVKKIGTTKEIQQTITDKKSEQTAKELPPKETKNEVASSKSAESSTKPLIEIKKEQPKQEPAKTQPEIEKAIPQQPAVKQAESPAIKTTSNNVATKIENKSAKPSVNNKEPAPKKEIDYGNPVFFISITIISTIIGFICLSFFKGISRLVRHFRHH